MHSYEQELFQGLQALSNSAFPKQCRTCNKLYHSPEDFFTHSQSINNNSGLKKSLDDDDTPIVELYRNCSCGSTLMDFFIDRRDMSPKGLKRREIFGKMLVLLERKGLPSNTARAELKGVMDGRHSDLLESLGIRLTTKQT